MERDPPVFEALKPLGQVLQRVGWPAFWADPARPERQGPPLPCAASWQEGAWGLASKVKFFGEMHKAATDARRSAHRDYGWAEWDRETGWSYRRKGPLADDRRRDLPSKREG